MAQLLVRGLDGDLVARLKIRAAENGRSAEEEHRRILRAALLPDPRKPFVQALLDIPNVGDDSDFERPRDIGRDVDL